MIKHRLSLIAPVFALALAAMAPLARGQDAPPPPPAGGGDDQAPPPPHRRGHGFSPEQLKAKLNLTDAQVTQVTAILAKQKDQMIALHEDDSISDEDKRTKMMDMMKATHDQIRAILTPAQQALFDAMKPGHGGPPPPPPPSE